MFGAIIHDRELKKLPFTLQGLPSWHNGAVVKGYCRRTLKFIDIAPS
jgi:hypothetical protein